MEKHGQKSGQMVKDGDVEEINNNKWEMECWSKVSRAIISVPAMEIRGKRGQRQGLVLQALLYVPRMLLTVYGVSSSYLAVGGFLTIFGPLTFTKAWRSNCYLAREEHEKQSDESVGLIATNCTVCKQA